MKKGVEMEKVIVMRETLLMIQVCSSIPPDQPELLEREVNYATGGPGTLNNRWVLSDMTDPPCRCGEYENRWHYLLVC